ncbi:MAG: hypothetical protein ACK6DP_18695 [Gemmatimonas sp.]|jgi:hypothetical protein|uniref:hypothetical protein n=2 Tax=Gemmatimonas sp. TaxID=1962908 RepID=UPI00391F9E24|nr:hypothetical protein [Gemmatimonadota bacterium]
MYRWMRRVRAAVVMGVTWALAWAPVGVLVGLVVDPDGSLDEMWFLIFGYPGFLGGVVFSIVLARRGRRCRVDELSVTRVGGWGAVAGLLVGTLPFLVGSPTNRIPLWLLASTVVSSTTLLSALSAAGTLAIARRGVRPGVPIVTPDENAVLQAHTDARAVLAGPRGADA